MKEKDKKQEKSKKQEDNQTTLGWFQIIMLMGKPLWDSKKQKWRILNGYQSVLGDNNQMFFEVTFTDTPYWENFVEKKLYINVPEEIKAVDNKKEKKK